MADFRLFFRKLQGQFLTLQNIEKISQINFFGLLSLRTAIHPAPIDIFVKTATFLSKNADFW